jgi:hypothetical protein
LPGSWVLIDVFSPMRKDFVDTGKQTAILTTSNA